MEPAIRDLLHCFVMSDLATLEALQAQIPYFQGQLSQVAMLLEADPSNEELIKMKQDLEELLTIAVSTKTK